MKRVVKTDVKFELPPEVKKALEELGIAIAKKVLRENETKRV